MAGEQADMRSTLTVDGVNPVSWVRRQVAHARLLVVGSFVRCYRHQVTGRASQFAFNAFLATVPLLFVLVSAIGLIVGTDAPTRVVSTYSEQIPESAKSLVEDALQSAVDNQGRAVVFLILGIAGALYVVGNTIGAIIQGLDEARGVPGRSWIHGKAVSIAFAGIWAALMTLANLMIIFGQDAVSSLRKENNLAGLADTLDAILVPVAVLTMFAMTYILYRYAPNAPRRRPLAYVPGVLVALVGLVGFSRLFAWYINTFNPTEVYGALVSVVVYLTFLYGVGMALLIGGEVNDEIVSIRRGRPTAAARPSPSVDQD
jgi:membrane protein